MQLCKYASMKLCKYTSMQVCHFVTLQSKQQIKNLLLQKLVCFVRYFKILDKKGKFTIISGTVTFNICPQMIALYMLLVICDFLYVTYYLNLYI